MCTTNQTTDSRVVQHKMYQIPHALLQACLQHKTKSGNAVPKWTAADLPTVDEFGAMDKISQDLLLGYLTSRYPCTTKIMDNETGIHPNKERLGGKRVALYGLVGLMPIFPLLATIFFFYPNIKKENLPGVIMQAFTVTCVFMFLLYKAM